MVSVSPLQRVSLTAGLTAVRAVTAPTPVGPATKAEEILPLDAPMDVVRGAAAQRAATLDALAAPSPELQKAVAVATQTAVARQAGLAPLMADLAQAATQPALPPALREAAAQVLAQRTQLTPALQAADVQDALARSGLLMEARIADGGPAPAPQTDLKAALLALRQTLRAVIANAPDAPATAGAPTAARPDARLPPPTFRGGPTVGQPPPQADPPAEPVAVAGRLLARTEGALARPTGLAPLMTDLAQAARLPTLPPQLRDAAAQVLAWRAQPGPGIAAADVEPPSAGAGPPAQLPGEAPQGDPEAAPPVLSPQPRAGAGQTPARPMPSNLAAQAVETQAAPPRSDPEPPPPAPAPQASEDPDLKAVLLALRQTLQAFVANAPATADASPSPRPGAKAPPPPFRGGPTQGQAPVDADLPAATGAAARRLLVETDGALARQQLLQTASLPQPHDPAGPATRWMFEVPFATPHGSAVGQFEIARDPPAAGAKDSQPTWRARFSLDLAPLGPLHAHVSLSGTHVGVALWAERLAGLAALRDHQPGLTKALLAARLSPDIAIYPGQPVSAQAAPGHFVDQAL
jgi:hypothetical protein